MARAKRTNRAEARRRHRALAAEQATAETPDATEGPAQPSSRGPRPPAEPRPSGMRYAFRAAFREPNLREDLKHLPQLLRSRAVLLPILVSAGTAVAIAATNGNDVISRLLAQYFLITPPIGSIFIAGFFAPRASYMAGFIVGLGAAIALTAVIVATPNLGATGATPGASPSASPGASAAAGAPSSLPASPSTSAASASAVASASPSPGASGSGEVPAANPVLIARDALLESPVIGIFAASAAAWYRRFLQLANPNRATPRGGQKGRPNNRRR